MGIYYVKKDKEPRQKRQFSKIHVVFADCLVLFVWVSDIFLILKGYQPISDLAITIVSVYGAFATGGYFTLNAVRDNSLNKYNAPRREEQEDA